MDSFIRVPPDSTGKYVRNLETLDLSLNNLQSAFATVEAGDVIEDATSLATGTVTGVFRGAESIIFLKDVSGTFGTTNTIRIQGGADVGDILDQNTQHTQGYVQVDPDNPNYRQAISELGAALVAFPEGEQLFDAFGNAKTSNTSKISEHIFIQTDDADSWWEDTRTGGSITHFPEESTLRLQTNTTSGSYAGRTSHFYHPYEPGTGNYTLMSMAVGDTGKSNVIRRWGYYDDDDGMFFELSGSVLKVGLRSSTSGTPSTTYVEQSNFNGEKLNSSTTGRFLLDVSKANLYWMDFQWLGVGKVRMGTFSPGGKRVTMHTFQNPNANNTTYMKRGTLPIKFEQFNELGAASTSEMKIACITVLRDAGGDSQTSGELYSYVSSNIITATGSNYTPIATWRPVVTQNGIPNRKLASLERLEISVSGSCDAIISTIRDASLTGSAYSYTTASNSAFAIDESATALSGGTVSDITLASVSQVTERAYNPTNELQLDRVIGLYADSTQPTATIAVKPVEPTGTVHTRIVVRWKEIK